MSADDENLAGSSGQHPRVDAAASQKQGVAGEAGW